MSWQQPRGGGSGFNPNAGAFNPNAGAFVPGGAPSPAGGAPSPAGGAPSPAGYGGGYNQGGYGNQGGYNQGGYGNQGGYNQGGYGNQGGYNQGGYGNQGGYNQGGYNNNRGGYNQGGYNNNQGYNNNRGGYNQGGYNQGGYNQGGYNQGGYQQQQQHQDPEPVKEEPKASANDMAKLSLGGSKKSEPIVMPKRKGGGKLVLGGAPAKKEEPKKEEPKKEEAKAEESKKDDAEKEDAEKKEDAEEKADDEKTESPNSTGPGTRKKRKNTKEYVRDPRPHMNIVFCGHVDAGKSTIAGHLMADQGVVDEREMAKLMREAEQNKREGWGYAYVFDASEEERAKGKTHETGAAYFETENRRVTVLDAPGHKAFVPSMIGGAAQADVCVLVISARTGEFETGFEKGGQTREHAMLVKTCGVKHMMCVINKMDEVDWSIERYNEILKKLRPFLKQNGFEEEKLKNLNFLPIAGLSGENLVHPLKSGICDWFQGKTLLENINTLTLPETKSENDVLAIPLAGSYKDDGKNFIYGKIEAGSIVVGDELQILPLKQKVVVEGLSVEGAEIDKGYPGDNIHVRVKGIEDGDVHPGFVLTEQPTPMKAVDYFQARIVILDINNIISAGTKVMMHMHTAQEEVTFHALGARLDKKTNEVLERNPPFVKAGDVVIARMEVAQSLVVEPYKTFDRFGRFMLREDGKTIAIGLVTKLYESTRADVTKKENSLGM